MTTLAKCLALGLSLLTLALALVFLGALDPRQAGARSSSAVIVAAGQDRLANQLMSAAASPAADRAAYQASAAAAVEAPFDTSALLRMAYIDQRMNGGLGPQGLAALRASYARAAFDAEVGFWRIRFALENWGDLPGDVRLSVQDEVYGFAGEPGHRWPLRSLLKSVRTGYGAPVASFWERRIANQSQGR